MFDFPTFNGSDILVKLTREKIHEHMKKKLGIFRSSSVQRRITIMFFVHIVVYVISYTTPLIMMVRLYMLEYSMFLTMTHVETGLWIYL